VNWESKRLFTWHAFNLTNPKKDYLELSIQAVAYAKGIPLALVLLGSFLKDRSVAEWENELKKLQRTPYVKIQNFKKALIPWISIQRPYSLILLVSLSIWTKNMLKKYLMVVISFQGLVSVRSFRDHL
jgi:hypothetical protein